MKKRQHSLRYTVLTLVGPVLFVFLAGFLAVIFATTTHILVQAEDKYLDQQRLLVEGFLSDAARGAFLMADDLAVWDETVAFMAGENPDYVASNWVDGSIAAAYGYHFVLYMDTAGRAVYSEYYNPLTGESGGEPAGLEQAVAPLALELAARYGGAPLQETELEQLGLGGILFPGGNTYYAAAMPVVQSRGQGPAGGVLVLGNRLDEQYLREMTYLSNIDFDIASRSGNEQADSEEPSGFIRQHNRVSTTIQLADWQGRPAYLTMSHSRDIYQSGIDQVAGIAVLLTLAMVLFILALYQIISRRALRPLEALSHDIAHLDINGKLEADKYSASREFTILCKAIDGLTREMRQSSISITAFESILNGINGFIYVSDPDTYEILFVNDRLAQAFGQREHLVGRPCWQVLQSGFDGPCDFCPMGILRENPHEQVEWDEHNTVTGRWYHNADRMISWADGRLVHLQMGLDTTVERLAQDALERRLEQQGLMSDIASSFISTESIDRLIHRALDMTGRFLDAGKLVIAALDEGEHTISYRYGWHNAERGVEPPHRATLPWGQGNPMYELFVNQALEVVSCHDIEQDDRFAYLKPFKVRAILMLPIYVDSRLWGCINIDTMDRPYTWTDSDIDLMQLIVSVIAGAISRSMMEQQLIAAKVQAEEMSRAKGDFLSRMSHEMRTPMNAIIGMTGIAQGTDDVARKDYCLDKVAGASRHLLGVINDILDMSKIESGKFELSESEFDLERMLMRVASVIGFRVDERHQNLTFHVEPDVPRYLVADEQRLSQVITNLLSNACKFTPEHGSITVDVRIEEERADGALRLRVEVKDTGIGISEEQQSRLFRSFEQADGGISRRFGGTGLGLAISRSIVEMMDGRIWIESQLGDGARFIFTACLRRSRRSPKSILPEGVSWGNLRVLVVDDTQEVREYFSTVAASMNLKCDTAQDGYEAMTMIEQQGNPYGIVFADWRMPGMDGIELTRKIKTLCGEQTVVIMISSTDWSVIEADAKAAGVDKYLAKPLFPSIIADCINQCMGISVREEEEARPEDDIEGRYAGRHILLAEDIEINREIVQSILEPAGLTITCAENGVEAVALFTQSPERFDLVFMDIHMPEMDGFEATRHIRALPVPQARSVPIIAMTANVFREDIDRCLAAGMNDHVGKPLDVSEVFQRLDRYLRP